MKIVIAILLIPISIGVMCQDIDTPILRHTKGISSIGLFSGTTYTDSRQTIVFRINYKHYLRRKLFLETHLVYQTGNVGITDIDILTLGAKLNHTLLVLTDNLYANANYGLLLGNQRLNNLSQKSQAIFGGSVGGKLEYYLSNRYSLDAEVNQFLILNSSINKFSYTIEIGLNYNF